MNFSEYPAVEEWSKAGVEGGIPDNLPILDTIKPGDDIQKAIRDAHDAGGGVVLLKKGVYEVDTPISFENNVVLRGEDRDGVIIKSSVRATEGSHRNNTFLFENKRYSGIENLTIDYKVPGLEPIDRDGLEAGPQYWPAFRNNPGGRKDLYVGQIAIFGGSRNNWVKGVSILNSGTNPITVSGDHNTLTNNFIDRAYNKDGGESYYKIRGDYNLIQGETVKRIRHFAIQAGAKYNVVTDSYFEVDVNFHSGDGGNNLIESNTINVPSWHGEKWDVFATGNPAVGHSPPGNNNILVNNKTKNYADDESPFSEKNIIYTFKGYGPPVATNLELPKGGEFYVPETETAAPNVPTKPTPEKDLITFALVNAETDEIVAGFEDLGTNSTISLDGLGVNQYNLVAQVNPDHPDAQSVQSVKFESPLGDRTENVKPYALFGDNGKGDFRGKTLDIGNFTVKATAYTQGGGNGQAVGTANLNYSQSVDRLTTRQVASGLQMNSDDLFSNDVIAIKTGNDKLYDDFGNYNLHDNQGNDLLPSNSTFEDSNGQDKMDVLTGGEGVNTFVPRGRTDLFYGDGQANTADKGDYALITDFNLSQGDRIEIGDQYNYTLGATHQSGGRELYVDLQTGDDELIGVIKGQGVETSS